MLRIRRSQPCTTFGGAEEPLGIENPRSSIDVVRADESGTEGANLEFPKGIPWRRSDCCAISTDDDMEGFFSLV